MACIIHALCCVVHVLHNGTCICLVECVSGEEEEGGGESSREGE